MFPLFPRPPILRAPDSDALKGARPDSCRPQRYPAGMQRCTHPLGSRHAYTHAGCGRCGHLVRLHRPLVLSQLVRVGQKRGALSGTPFPLTTAPVHSDSSSYFRSFPPDDGSASPLIHAATYRCARYGMPFLHVLRHADVHIQIAPSVRRGGLSDAEVRYFPRPVLPDIDAHWIVSP